MLSSCPVFYMFRWTLNMEWIFLGIAILNICYGQSEVSSFAWKKDVSITDLISTSGYTSSRYVRSRYDCGWDCYADNTCMAFFYNQNTALCVTERTIRQSTAGLTALQGTSYYALTGDQIAEKMCSPPYTEDFQIVRLSDNTYLQIRIFRTNVVMATARDSCVSFGATLFRPTSPIKHALIQDLFKCQGVAQYYWMDGKKDTKCSPWTTWDYSHTYTTTYWSGSNPDNPTTELCLETLPDGRWNDKQCDFISNYICEKPV